VSVPRDVPTAVYRLFDAEGVLLYIGASINPQGRLNYHQFRSYWPSVVRIELIWYSTRVEARAAERAAIEAEAPRLNSLFSPVASDG
jgi:hypothetical protein